jgi:hypothetical protein
MQHTAEFGLSERFIAIMRHLRAARIPYARFDADGGEIEGIERTDTTAEMPTRALVRTRCRNVRAISALEWTCIRACTTIV